MLQNRLCNLEFGGPIMAAGLSQSSHLWKGPGRGIFLACSHFRAALSDPCSNAKHMSGSVHSVCLPAEYVLPDLKMCRWWYRVYEVASPLAFVDCPPPPPAIQ